MNFTLTLEEEPNHITKRDITMKRIRTSNQRGCCASCTLIVCALIFTVGVRSGIAADENLKVTLVSDHELPNVPGKSLRAVLVEYRPGRRVALPSASFVGIHLCARAGGSIRSRSERRADVPIKPARAGPSGRVIITRLARMPAPRLRRSCSPSSWSTQAIVRS